MADRVKEIAYNGFHGGLSSIEAGEKCLPSQLQRATNVMIIENGVVRKRYGAIMQKIDAAAFVIDIASNFHSCNNKKIYSATAVDTHTYANGGLGQFIKFDKDIHTNGIDAMVDLTVYPAAAVMGAPLSRIIFKHNDRCFVANGANLYETAPGTYPSSTVDNFAGGASWLIGDTNTKIIGLGSIGRNLLIFKSDSIHLQTGYTKAERQTFPFSTEHGCVSPDSIKNVDMTGLGLAVMFLSKKGKLCAATMNGVVEIGEAVQDILDTIYYGTAVNEFNPGVYLHRARAGVIDGEFYVLGFAVAATDTAAIFTQALCVSLKLPYESQFGQRWPVTLWQKTAEVNVSGQTFGAFSLPDLNGYTLVPTTFPGTRYGYSKFDKTLYQDWQVTIADVVVKWWIDMYVQTRQEDCGEIRYLKNWLQLLLDMIQIAPATGNAFFAIKVTQDVDYNLDNYVDGHSDDPPTVFEENVITPLRDLQGLDPGLFPNRLYEFKHGIVGDGQQTSILVKNYETSAEADLRIHGMQLLYSVCNVS